MMSLKNSCLSIFLLLMGNLNAQVSLNIVTPSTEITNTTTAKQFITGTTCKECSLLINGSTVKVYKTGVFAYQCDLKKGLNSYLIEVKNGKKSTTKKIEYNLNDSKPIKATDSAMIEQITMEPSGDVALQAGETVVYTVKAKPNCQVYFNDKYLMKELPKSLTKGIAGYYQYTYRFKEREPFILEKPNFSLYHKEVKVYAIKDKNTLTLFDSEEPMIGITKRDYTPWYIGLGADRLGGTKAGYLDSSVQLHIVGRINDLYKVKCADNIYYYINRENVEILPPGAAVPLSLSNNITVVGDSTFDYVKISFSKKLPYTTHPTAQPNSIVVDIFGATSNSNWLMQYPETLQEIQNVDIEQNQQNLLRLTIDLKTNQLWGYKTYYEGATLVIKIRRKKENLSLQNIVIGLDAGHGGSNDGARGISGRYEKEFTLLIAKEVEKLLKEEGAKVLMTRSGDISYENNARMRYFLKEMPDIALSIHLNSAGDPLRVKGTSTYYKYSALKGLSSSIYKRMAETGLRGWGLIGNFNFYLNSVTEFPTSLVETLFISNPEDEEKVHDEAFRKEMAQKIVQGIKDWLLQVGK